MDRYTQQRSCFQNRRFFKVVCGAGNEDPDEVYRLSQVYTLAGALGIDVSANVEVVQASRRGIQRAFELAPSLNIQLETEPFITVSVGLKGDPHVRKARILEDNCTACGDCFEHCEQQAVGSDPYRVIDRRCIGCGKCETVCEYNAVEYYTRKVDFDRVLPACLEAGAENFELHAIIADDEKVLRDWRILNRILPDNFISMCLDRSHLSNNHLLSRIAAARELTGERLIIQADGAPMSGGSDNFNTTLQAIAIADIIQKSGLDVTILLSGGTNGQTGELARLCGIPAHGVSIGTFARNLVRVEIEAADFDNDLTVLSAAVQKGRRLVDATLDPLQEV